MKSVLLTTSLDGSPPCRDIVHVGWQSVHKAIDSLQEDGGFRSNNVGAFVRQYRELLERQFGFTEGGGTMALLKDHRAILEKMLRLLEKDGADGVEGKVPADRVEYRDALVRLVQESGQDPKQLRWAVRDHLESRGCETWSSHNAQGIYWLNWTDGELRDTSRLLGGESHFLSWGLTFTHREVSVGFYLYRPGEERGNPFPLDWLMRFMEDTPIDRLEPDRYQIVDRDYGWHRVYHRALLPEDEFAGMSVSEGRDEVLRRLRDFMGSNASDYRRIDDYFRCLAFHPGVSTPARKSSP